MPTLSLRIIKKPRRKRWCDTCGKRLEGETIRLYGMAEYGDKPYAVFLHRGCLSGKNELAMLEATEHRLSADNAPLLDTSGMIGATIEILDEHIRRTAVGE